MMTPRIVWAIAGEQLGAAECARVAEQMLAQAAETVSLHAMIDALARRVSGTSR